MINVVAAIIEKENKILITKRNLKKSQGGLWEFPGGKIEEGETKQEALKREIKEELDLDIEVYEQVTEKVHHYPDKDINLISFKCKIISGELKLIEHEEYKWVLPGEMSQYEFAEADKWIVENIRKV